MSESPDVCRPQVHRRLSAFHPLGKHLAGASCAGDSRRVKSSCDIEVAQCRRVSKNELVVRRETLRTIHKLRESAGLQSRNAFLALLQGRFKLLPVLLQELETEVGRNGLDHPWFGVCLKCSQEHRIVLTAEVNRSIWIACAGHLIPGAFNWV